MESDNYERLKAMAEQDDSFGLWRKSYQQYAEPFERFAGSQPKEIRELLWGYAESGRLMMQRMVNLACDHMEFKKE